MHKITLNPQQFQTIFIKSLFDATVHEYEMLITNHTDVSDEAQSKEIEGVKRSIEWLRNEETFIFTVQKNKEAERFVKASYEDVFNVCIKEQPKDHAKLANIFYDKLLSLTEEQWKQFIEKKPKLII